MRNQRTLSGAILVVLAAAVLTFRRRRAGQREDLAVVLIELLAAMGDLMSAYQDALAEEGYLGTPCGRRRRRTR
jgi:hypothetical protein